MNVGELERLSGAELKSRLVNRGVPAWIAEWWVANRSDREVRDKILRVINEVKGYVQ